MSQAVTDADGGRATFRRQERIRKRGEYLRVYDEGIRRHTQHFTLLLRRNALGVRRLGLSVGRHAGKAAKRNRIKRFLREFFRCHKDLFPASHDVVIIAKRKAPPRTYGDVAQELTRLLAGGNARENPWGT